MRNKKHYNKISQAAFPVVTRSRDQVPKLKFIANFIVKPSRSIESVGKCTVRRYQVSIQRSSYSYTIERSLSKEREIHQIRNCNCNNKPLSWIIYLQQHSHRASIATNKGFNSYTERSGTQHHRTFIS